VKTRPEEIIEIRSYQDSDLDKIYEICLLTGDSGKDATGIYSDPKLLGHFYATPYAIIEPELCFIVTIDGLPSGYILGTRNSQKFRELSEKEWFAKLRKKYSLPSKSDTSPDSRIIRLIYEGYTLKDELKDFPAHLHIDLLPATQGKGIGKQIMLTFINKLKELNVPALHLEVGKKNENAIGFYKRIGFHVICEYEHSVAFGIVLE
jgi:ribosomal protein S18 acetylase RimI-like enzyme